MSHLHFEPPGPGTWHLNEQHCPRPLSRYFQEFYLDCFIEGANDGYGSYGLPYDWDSAIVNGWWYVSRQPVDGFEAFVDATADGNTEVSPSGTFKTRVEAARTTYEDKRWRTDLTRWDDEWKPELLSTYRALRDDDPDVLDDEGLIGHLRDCREAVLEAAYYHHRMSACGNFPFADYLAFVRTHSDCSPQQAVALLDGASPESAGPVGELERVVAAVAADIDAQNLILKDQDPGHIIDRLREWDGELGAAVDEWLDVVGYQPLTGYDVADAYGLERPGALVSTLQTALETETGTSEVHDPEDARESIRQQVPADEQDRFDERLEESRLTYRVRDERSLIDVRMLGIARRALLAAGRRLADRGRLRDFSHVVEFEHEEVLSALQGDPAPSAREVAAHAAHRTSHNSDDAPSVLGPDPSPPAPADEFPESMARLMRGLEANQWANAGGMVEEPDTEIAGHGASPGTVRGSARVITGPDDFDDISKGDILVAEATSSAFNTILPLLGGVVTDKGGMLSHPAIVSREFGIPGVVGCEDATDRLQDGDQIIVDGDHGTIRFVSEDQ